MDALEPPRGIESMDARALTSARRSETHRHLRRQGNQPYAGSLLTLEREDCRLAEPPALLSA